MMQRPTFVSSVLSFGLCIFYSFLLAFVSSVLSFGLCIICPFLLAFVSSVLFLWPLYHLSLGQKKRTDDTKVKRKGPDDIKAKRKGQMI
jgi:hypothetical protein